MPRLIELSEAALADFDGIYDHIAKYSPRAAAKVLGHLDTAIQRLADQPRMGQVFRYRRHRLRLPGVLPRSTGRDRTRAGTARHTKYSGYSRQALCLN